MGDLVSTVAPRPPYVPQVGHVYAYAQLKSIRVEWRLPQAPDEYRGVVIRTYPGGARTIVLDKFALDAVVTGLTSGKYYTFTVATLTPDSESAESSPSNSVRFPHIYVGQLDAAIPLGGSGIGSQGPNPIGNWGGPIPAPPRPPAPWPKPKVVEKRPANDGTGDTLIFWDFHFLTRVKAENLHLWD